jgi:hypothetical protein
MKPVSELLFGWHPKRDVCRGDLALGADQPLRHGGLGHQKRSRALRGGQAAEQPQRQRDLGLQHRRRVAAHGRSAGADHRPPVLRHRRPSRHRQAVRVAAPAGGLVEQLPAAAFPSQPIQRPVPRGRGDPTARIGRQSVTSPPRSTATANASWTASSARSTSPRTRIRVATAWPDSSRKIRPISSTSGPPTARARGTVPTRRRYRRTATTRWACRSRRRSAAPSPTPRRGRTRR